MLFEHLHEIKFYLETCKIKINMIIIWKQRDNNILKKLIVTLRTKILEYKNKLLG